MDINFNGESDIQDKLSANSDSRNTKWELVQSHSKRKQGSSSSLAGKLSKNFSFLAVVKLPYQ